MRLPLRLLEELTGTAHSAHTVAHYLSKVGFPVEEIIELLPFDPQVKTAMVEGVVERLDDGIIVTVECGEERFHAYSHTEIASEGIIAIAFEGSPIVKENLGGRDGVSAVVVTEKDLGLDDDYPVILPVGTQTGLPLAEVIESTVLNVEITPNRGDLYSLYGLARELSPLIGESFNVPSAPLLDIVKKEHNFKLSIEADEDIRQYYGFLIEGVKIQPSPFWLRWRLHAFGARPVNNIVDISNYVMFITGQPLHAFDASVIRGGRVRVRRAKELEKITAIDHKTYELSPHCLLIADEDHPLAIAGIMGGEGSEVNAGTKRIFLESAEFVPQPIRFGIGATGLQSDSSKRFAAGIDGAITRDAALVFIDMLQDILADATVSGELAWGSFIEKDTVTLAGEKLDSYASTGIDLKKESRNLELIGFKVEITGKTLFAKVPSHRNDLLEDVDLIEEILRLRGYDDLPSRFIIKTDSPGKTHELSRFLNHLRSFLSGLGLSETYSLTFLSKKEIEDEFAGETIELTNPLSERMSVMRPSLASGLLAIASNNIRFGEENLALYEIGNVFSKKDPDSQEMLRLGILLCGKSEPLSWDRAPRNVDFFDIKGIVEMLCIHFGLNPDEMMFEATTKSFYTSEACSLTVNGCYHGIFGKVAPQYLEKAGISEDIFYAELDLSELYKLFSKKYLYKPLSRFHSTERDLALLLDASVVAQQVMQFVQREAGDICAGVDIFDNYSAKPLAEGKRNLGLRLLFVPKNRNFSKDELDGIMSDLSEKVAVKFNAQIRGREGDGN